MAHQILFRHGAHELANVCFRGDAHYGIPLCLTETVQHLSFQKPDASGSTREVGCVAGTTPRFRCGHQDVR